MSVTNSFKFVMLPPQTDVTRAWGKRLADTVPEARVVVVEDAETAARACRTNLGHLPSRQSWVETRHSHKVRFGNTMATLERVRARSVWATVMIFSMERST